MGLCLAGRITRCPPHSIRFLWRPKRVHFKRMPATTISLQKIHHIILLFIDEPNHYPHHPQSPNIFFAAYLEMNAYWNQSTSSVSSEFDRAPICIDVFLFQHCRVPCKYEYAKTCWLSFGTPVPPQEQHIIKPLGPLLKPAKIHRTQHWRFSWMPSTLSDIQAQFLRRK